MNATAPRPRLKRCYPVTVLGALLVLLASSPATPAGLPEARPQVWRTTGPTCGSVSFLRATRAPGPVLWTGFAYGGAIFRSDDLGRAWRETGVIQQGLWVQDVVFEPNRE